MNCASTNTSKPALRLFADAGSTSTSWALATDDTQRRVVGSATTGPVNPAVMPREAIDESVAEAAGIFTRHLAEIRRIDFFGSGCREPFSNVVAGVLAYRFPSAEGNIQVESDMLGACIAVCGIGRPGIVGILGTGSNFCYYDGSEIALTVPSLGYILGDEGSGSHIGRLLLNAAFKGTLPDNLSHEFFAAHPIDVAGVIEHAYRQPKANTYIASFARFAGLHCKHPAIVAILDKAFSEMAANNLVPLCRRLQEQGIHLPQVYLAGSIAAIFAPQIEKAVASIPYSISLGSTIASPLQSIIENLP